MVDEPENIVLPALNRIREQNDTILRKLDEVITRLGAVERDIAGMEVDYAATQLRLDNMDRRIGGSADRAAPRARRSVISTR